MIRATSKKVLKKVEKIFKKDLVIQKKVFTFAPALKSKTDSSDEQKGSEKILKKIFQKDLVVSKITLIFAPLSAENQRQNKGPKSKD